MHMTNGALSLTLSFPAGAERHHAALPAETAKAATGRPNRGRLHWHDNVRGTDCRWNAHRQAMTTALRNPLNLNSQFLKSLTLQGLAQPARRRRASRGKNSRFAPLGFGSTRTRAPSTSRRPAAGCWPNTGTGIDSTEATNSGRAKIWWTFLRRNLRAGHIPRAACRFLGVGCAMRLVMPKPPFGQAALVVFKPHRLWHQPRLLLRMIAQPRNGGHLHQRDARATQQDADGRPVREAAVEYRP